MSKQGDFEVLNLVTLFSALCGERSFSDSSITTARLFDGVQLSSSTSIKRLNRISYVVKIEVFDKAIAKWTYFSVTGYPAYRVWGDYGLSNLSKITRERLHVAVLGRLIGNRLAYKWKKTKLDIWYADRRRDQREKQNE